MDINETRRENLLKLLADYRDRVNDGREHGLLRDFGIASGVSDRQLSHLKSGRRNLGTATARLMEKSLGLPHGWMDEAHSKTMPESEAESLFVELALRLYRASPTGANMAILNAMEGVTCRQQNGTGEWSGLERRKQTQRRTQ